MDRRVFTAASALVVATAGIQVAGCIQIDAAEPTDNDGDPVARPGPADRWLRVTDLSPPPGDISRRPSITVTFNDYLDDDSFRSFNFATLASGGLNAGGRATYLMTDKAVVWRATGRLETGLAYEFSVDQGLVSATGSPLLRRAEHPTFVPRAGIDAAGAAERPDADWSDVEAIFDQRCADCHSQPDAGLSPLTYDALVGADSAQTDLYLVRPGDPPDSYLMRKILPDYPDIEFVHQPPPWAAQHRPLSRPQLRIIEAWIATGAHR